MFKNRRYLLTKLHGKMPDNVKYVLTPLEQFLAFIAFIVVVASIAMALCIGLILPYHWFNETCIDNYITGNSSTNRHCAPRVFTERIMPPQTEEPDVYCELIQNYPFLVSLNAPAYSDDKNERRFACSGTILSKEWIFVGTDCVQNEDELKELRVRAGSSYWAKGGTEYIFQASSKYNEQGPMALKVTPPFTFSKYIGPVKTPKKGVYTSWISAVSAGWSKDVNRKYQKFVVQKWSTASCQNNCQKGEVRGEPSCEPEAFGRALIADTGFLIGVQNGICYAGGNTNKYKKYMFTDLQNDDYAGWFEYLLGSSRKRKNKRILKAMQRNNMGTTASPLEIYEIKHCVTLRVTDSESVNEDDRVSDNYENTSELEINDKESTITKIELSDEEQTSINREIEISTTAAIYVNPQMFPEQWRVNPPFKEIEDHSTTEAEKTKHPKRSTILFSNFVNNVPFRAEIDVPDEYADNDNGVTLI